MGPRGEFGYDIYHVDEFFNRRVIIGELQSILNDDNKIGASVIPEVEKEESVVAEVHKDSITVGEVGE